MKNLNFLIIENSPQELQKLRQMFNSFEGLYKVYEAKDSNEALQILHKENGKIDVVLLGMNSNDVIEDGLKFIKSLKENEKYLHIPVTVISGDTNPDVMYSCYTSGVSGFIEKPQESTIYIDKLKHLIDYWRYNEFHKN